MTRAIPGERLVPIEERAALTWQDLVYVLDLFGRAGSSQISLRGCEPAVHADALDMIDYVLERGFDALVGTSGLLDAAARARVASLTEKHRDQRLEFVVQLGA